jgi:hypothetical protein
MPCCALLAFVISQCLALAAASRRRVRLFLGLSALADASRRRSGTWRRGLVLVAAVELALVAGGVWTLVSPKAPIVSAWCGRKTAPNAANGLWRSIAMRSAAVEGEAQTPSLHFAGMWLVVTSAITRPPSPVTAVRTTANVRPFFTNVDVAVKTPAF